MEDTEGQAKSETSSVEEADAGLDSDVEVIRLNGHLFGLGGAPSGDLCH